MHERNHDKSTSAYDLEPLDTVVDRIREILDDVFYENPDALNPINNNDLADLQKNVLYIICEKLEAEGLINALSGKLHVKSKGTGMIAYHITTEDEIHTVLKQIDTESYIGSFESLTIGDTPWESDITKFFEDSTESVDYCHFSIGLEISDVTIYNEVGDIISDAERSSIIVPIIYTGTKLSKVHRKTDGMGNTLSGHEEDRTEEISLLFNNPDTAAAFAIAENDLQYNDYSPSDHRQLREDYQMTLSQEINIAEDRLLLVDCSNIHSADGSIISAQNNLAYYEGVVMILVDDSWRAYHTFTLINDEGTTGTPICVLPHDIHTVMRLDDLTEIYPEHP